MTPAVELLTAAEEDMAVAKEWYRQCHLQLEADFVASVEEALERIGCHPFAFARIKHEYRQALLHRFPYRIVFRLLDDLIVVVAVLHTSRDPRVWESRNH